MLIKLIVHILFHLKINRYTTLMRHEAQHFQFHTCLFVNVSRYRGQIIASLIDIDYVAFPAQINSLLTKHCYIPIYRNC
jgi:hypothetical protein